MSKSIIIDTNLLYYWAETEKSDHHSSLRISEELKNKKVFVSELSFLELIIKYEYYPAKIKQILDFLQKEKIGIFPMIPGFYLPFIVYPNILISQDHFPAILELVKKRRVEIEADLLLFLISSIAAETSLGILHFDSENPIDKQKYLFHIAALLAANQDEIYQALQYHLNEFYKDKSKEATDKLKEEIYTILDSLVYVVAVNHNVIDNNKELKDLRSDSDLSEEETKEVSENFSKNKFRKVLKTQINQDGTERKPIFKQYINDIDSFLYNFENEMIQSMSKGTVSYYKFLLKKIFTTGRKINKNDMIDSIFFNAFPNFQLYTADKKFRDVLEEIDIDYFMENERFLAAIEPPGV